jgi:hypothetical protein
MSIDLERNNMKRLSQYLFGIVLGLSLVLSALPGHAQDSDRVNVTIPFDFVVGAKQLKAGDYVVESVLDGRALKLRSKGGEVQQTTLTVPITNQTGNHERLLFHHDGDQYFLSQVWFWGNEDGREVHRGVQEKSLGKRRPASDQVIVGQ